MMFANNSKYIFEGARISGGDHLVSLSTFMSSNDHWNFTSNSKKDWNLILTHIQHISRSLLAHDTWSSPINLSNISTILIKEKEVKK